VIEEYMKEYPLKMGKMLKVSMRYIYDRVGMNEELINSKGKIKPLTSYNKL